MAASLRVELLGAGNASLPARVRVRDLLGPHEVPGGIPETPLELRVVSTLAHNAAVDDLHPPSGPPRRPNRALASPALSHDPVAGGESMIMAGAALQAAERLEECEDLFRRALDASRRNGSAIGIVAAAMRSASRYRRGRLEGTAADVETVIELRFLELPYFSRLQAFLGSQLVPQQLQLHCVVYLWPTRLARGLDLSLGREGRKAFEFPHHVRVGGERHLGRMAELPQAHPAPRRGVRDHLGAAPQRRGRREGRACRGWRSSP